MLSRVTRGWAPTSLVAPLIVGLGVFLLLAAFVSADPAPGVTVSTSPFTDEAWNVLNARNLVLLGHWSTGDWNLYLVNLPYSLLAVLSFKLLGVGIIQARMVDIVVTALTAAVLLGGLRRHLGGVPAFVASLGFASSLLILYYGRLAYLEPLVAVSLVGAALLAAPVTPRYAGPRGLLAGALLAVAIATKASAAFAGGGILLGVVVAGVFGWRAEGTSGRSARLAMLRWLGGAILVMAAVGAAWWYFLARPDLAAVRADLRIWAAEPIPRTFSQLLERIRLYPKQADGAIVDALPLLVGGGLGTLVSLVGWRHLGSAARRLLVVGVGWFVVGWGVLLMVPYRPNRYVVPMLPALAILTAVGLAAALAMLRTAPQAHEVPDEAQEVEGVEPAADAPQPAPDMPTEFDAADEVEPSPRTTDLPTGAPDAAEPTPASADGADERGAPDAANTPEPAREPPRPHADEVDANAVTRVMETAGLADASVSIAAGMPPERSDVEDSAHSEGAASAEDTAPAGEPEPTAEAPQSAGASPDSQATTQDAEAAPPAVETADRPAQSAEDIEAPVPASARPKQQRYRLASIALIAVVLLALTLPGLLSYGSWMLAASHDLPATQAKVRSILPAGAVVEGAYAPLLAMSAPVITLVSRPAANINAGDLYATRHVRWVVSESGSTPAWSADHPAAWAARRPVLCVPWGKVQLCLEQVP